jgi:Phosphodiester glycosidase
VLPTTVTRNTPPPPPPQPRVRITRVRTADGALVTVATFLGPVRYVLHDGSGDPGPVAGLRAGPAVAGAERSRLLAAFNGGFKLAAGVGGYMQEGRVLSPLRPGLASLVIDRSGQARIGVWHHGVPAPGEAIYSVRQNLPPLVLHGRPTAASADWGLWGATLGGGAYVARSAIGQDAAGDLIYAASMSAVPADLASVLASHRARTAMELDINPAWVQLDVAHRPGGRLIAEVPGQNRPADQYLVGWSRDFFTVVAAPAGPPAAPPRLEYLRP